MTSVGLKLRIFAVNGVCGQRVIWQP
jgi:hypothetical protein